MDSGFAFDETEFLVSLDEPEKVFRILQDLEVCGREESIVSIEKAGEGNMNLVMRVVTDAQSLVVKQARPWVEKYPAIAAPVDRVLAETDFYRRIAGHADVANVMPKIIAASAELRLLVIQDLGRSADYTSLYTNQLASDQRDLVFKEAIGWLRMLHNCPVDESDEVIGCVPLRQLNKEHMFAIPFADPSAISLDGICEGLEKESLELRQDAELSEIARQLGEFYLNPGARATVLSHGDFYPGSWLSTRNGFRVIDPEFCFYGPPEFDLGVLSAHLILCHAPAKKAMIDAMIETYGADISKSLAYAFAGAELIRRLIGVAQLPLEATLSQRLRWLELGRELLLGAWNSRH